MDAREFLPILADGGVYLPIDSAEETGVCCVLANVLDRPVSIICFSQKISVSAPAKILKLLDKTLKTGTPLLLVFSSPSRAGSGVSWCDVKKSIARLSGICPLIALVPDGESEYARDLLPYMDFIVYVGGTHEQTATCMQEPDVISAIEKIRTFLSYLPLNCAESAPLVHPAKHTVSQRPSVPSYSVLAKSISDAASTLQLYADLHVQVGFSRINGRVVGVLACENGQIPSHAVRFIRFCDCYSLPVLIISEKPLAFDPVQFFVLAQATTVLLCVGACGDNAALFDCVIGLHGLACEMCDCACAIEEVRERITQALELLHVKRDVLPPHKHSNFPMYEVKL